MRPQSEPSTTASFPFVEPLESRTFLSVTAPYVVPGVGPTPTPGAVLVAAKKPATGTPALTATLSGVNTVGLAGSATKDSVKVTLTNSGTGPAKGPVTIILFTSTDQLLDDADTQVTAITKNVSIAPGKSKTLTVKLGHYPNVPNGTYWLLAQVSGAAAGATTTAVSPNTVRIASAFVDLTGSFVSVPSVVTNHKRATVVLDVTNNGTVQAKGRLTVNFGRSAQPDGSNTEVVTNVVKSIRLAPRGHVQIKLSGNVDLSPGTFYMVAIIDPANAFNDQGGAPNVIVNPTPTQFT